MSAEIVHEDRLCPECQTHSLVAAEAVRVMLGYGMAGWQLTWTCPRCGARNEETDPEDSRDCE
jgi:rubredoxin